MTLHEQEQSHSIILHRGLSAVWDPVSIKGDNFVTLRDSCLMKHISALKLEIRCVAYK